MWLEKRLHSLLWSWSLSCRCAWLNLDLPLQSVPLGIILIQRRFALPGLYPRNCPTVKRFCLTRMQGQGDEVDGDRDGGEGRPKHGFQLLFIPI